jgi:hypothetical protein
LPDDPDGTFLDPYELCDLDGDGQGIFNLTIQDDAVFGIQDRADFAPIRYYEDILDAQAGNNNFIDPANAFPSAGQTVYVRLESLITGCFKITPFDLVVNQFPTHGPAADLEACDDEVNGSTSTDGKSTFDLTLNTLPIQDGDTSLTILYYADENDQTNNIPIDNPAEYQNEIVPRQEIFVTVTGLNLCEDNFSFFITVNPNPEAVQPTPLYACDVDNDGDAFFDLESKTAEIQGGDTSLIVTYHDNPLDASTGAFPLNSPYENIILYNQPIYVRVAFANPPAGTGCFTVVVLDLIVNPTPEVPQDLPDLIACDDDDFALFDLTEQRDRIYGTQSQDDFTLTYHLTEADATAGTPLIAQPDRYTNITNPQTI